MDFILGFSMQSVANVLYIGNVPHKSAHHIKVEVSLRKS